MEKAENVTPSEMIESCTTDATKKTGVSFNYSIRLSENRKGVKSSAEYCPHLHTVEIRDIETGDHLCDLDPYFIKSIANLIDLFPPDPRFLEYNANPSTSVSHVLGKLSDGKKD